MMITTATSLRRRGWLIGLPSLLLLPLVLSGCAALAPHDALKVMVAGVEPLQGEGLELRFLVKLRVQNPNDAAIEFNGVALELELNGKSLASGVSDQTGVVPRFGETLLEVPLTVSAFAAVRQAMGLSGATERGEMPYVVSGKLAGGLFGSVHFKSSGTLQLPK
jgi:LEA14-like dessication related protein